MKNSEVISRLDYELLKEKYKDEKSFEQILKKIYEENYPVQYAIGNVEFLNVQILVDERVLIPRFCTELLVHKLIEYVREYNLEKSNIIDLCTGSGAIAVALKKNFYNSFVLGVDISREALEVANLNKEHNNVDVQFVNSNVLENINLNRKFSVLVANPPYVGLNEEVSPNTKYEPRMALFPGEDDIIFYKKILENSRDYLTKKNIIAFEIGYNQGKRVREEARKVFPNSDVLIQKDYEGYERFVFIFNK